MKDKDFQQLVDHEFAQLEWTDQQRMDTLRKMKKEDRPVMKRKFYVVLVAAMLLLTLTGTAVAAGITSFSLQDFFNYWFEEGIFDGYSVPVIDQSAVITPVSQRHTSALVDVQVEQLYLSNEALYFTIRYTPKAANTLLFGPGVTSVTIDGEEKDYWDLWDHKELTLLDAGSVSIDDPQGRYEPIPLITGTCVRDPETGAITEMYNFRDMEKLTRLRAFTGDTLMLRFQVFNLANHELERNVIFVDCPQMEPAEKDPLDFTYTD